MTLQDTVFRPYDIRGIIPDQLDEHGAATVAHAFSALLQPQTVIVGRDVRLTGPAMQKATIEALVANGVDVIDIGVVSTDAFYFACGSKGLPGLMVTASHNPPEYNGFKMVRSLPTPVLSEELKPYLDAKPSADQPGNVTEEDVTDAFLAHLLEIVPANRIKPLKVVVDTSNGAQGRYWEKLGQLLPIELMPQFFEPDGNFPNHGNDVIQPENQELLRRRVVKEQADIGLIFDPDGDRCLAVDNRGLTIPGDFITALLAVAMLKKQPGSTIVYDIRASDVVPDMVAAAGGKPFGWKIGHAFIKPKMQEHDAVFGGEVSGHFYFKDFWFADCGLLSGLTMLEYLSDLGQPLSTKLEELEQRYHLSGEINSTVASVPATLEAIKAKYATGELSELDGIAIRYPDWHFVVRPSSNEPLLRLTLEANSRELMEAKRDELLALIRA